MPSATSPSPQPSTLPPPCTFDFLPPLHHLLSRLLLPPLNPGDQATPAANPLAPSNQPLEPKDVARETARIKQMIQNARLAVAELPDIDRTIEEQKAEIRELEERISRQREVLKEVAGAGQKIEE
ncbi:hypothetical protein MMC30_007487 [Trapelia coarctata]|nr:hypothetical protein [Trapelia coarctata]